MNNAIYIKDGVKHKITADSILSRKEYLETYRGHLFCPHPNCSAKVSFAETPTFTNKKIFKTLKNSIHSEDCPYKINYSTKEGPHFTSEIINSALSDRHKRDILKKLFYRNQDPTKTALRSSHTASKTKRADPDADVVTVSKSTASIDPNALPVQKGIREPIVKKRRCSDIISEDVGKLLALDDYANTAIISDKYIEIILESNTTLLFYNSFNESSPGAFSLVKSLASELITNKTNLLICFIGIVEKKPSGYQIQIMDPSLITFNDNYIYNYRKESKYGEKSTHNTSS